MRAPSCGDGFGTAVGDFDPISKILENRHGYPLIGSIISGGENATAALSGFGQRVLRKNRSRRICAVVGRWVEEDDV